MRDRQLSPGLSNDAPVCPDRIPSAASRRIIVVGVTGSGKTTLAHQISERLGIRHIELDALHWGPNWTETPLALFREQVVQALSGDTWVMDGNYSKVRDISWQRADTIVWLDYPLPLILWRLFWRTMRRVASREELWNGNRERLWEQFFSRESIFLWALQSYRRRRREYPALFYRPEYAHLRVVRLRSPGETRQWIVHTASSVPDDLHHPSF